ncbi:EAL domain-containing response regulator [Shewanella donghaensis]|uniref:EAL domain-containing response regulator n=1 Tax=Shewanella donghaensis TaxID=238836 RepID=UPI001183490E|nr:EAL domain-containing response regulator [Shewanella donghaensis]
MKREIKSILVVDDQAVIRRIFTRSLERLGSFTIAEAPDGLAAFNQIKTQHFDMVFCDLNMPVKDGLYLLQRLIEIQFTCPIVLFSGEDETLLNSAKVLATHYHLNILGIVPKPITSTMLQDFLDKAANCSVKPQNKPAKALTQNQIKFYIDNGNVRAYLQPQYNLQTMQICGFEALARIIDKDMVIAPANFINVAEESQLILPLTKAVIEDAIKHFALLDEQYRHLNLSINISGKILDDETLPQWIESVVIKNNLSNSSITCELTETAIPSSQSVMIVALLRLRMMKFKLSIDDFGTGFASLEQLHMLPFNELKIDRCFVHDIITNSRSQALFKRSILLAEDLGLTAVAEGIEDINTVECIIEMGCKIGQGFYFCKPFIAEKIINNVNQYGLGFRINMNKEFDIENT